MRAYSYDRRLMATQREKWPDGRWKPLVGDVVYQYVRGTGGTRAKVVGEVRAPRPPKQQPGIKLLYTEDVFGGRRGPPTGRQQRIDEDWTVEGDPHVQARREQAEAEAQRLKQLEQKWSELVDEAIQAKVKQLRLRPLRTKDPLHEGLVVYALSPEGDWRTDPTPEVEVRRMTIGEVEEDQFVIGQGDWAGASYSPSDLDNPEPLFWIKPS